MVQLSTTRLVIGLAAISVSLLLEASPSAQQQRARKLVETAVGTAKTNTASKPQLYRVTLQIAAPPADTLRVRRHFDPPPRVDPLPERALRLRLIDAPSVTIRND